MAGRPIKENRRDKQYRVRLNEEEDEMLSFCSEKTGKPKSDIVRSALKTYYENAKNSLESQAESFDLEDMRMEYENYDADEDYDIEEISLKRVINCPYCKAANTIDFTEYSESSENERGMGTEVEHSFVVDDVECNKCEKKFKVFGSIWEYPLGKYNEETIRVEKLEDDEE